MSKFANQCRQIFSTAVVLATFTLVSIPSMAEPLEPKVQNKKLGPASRISGSNAIDLNNGLPGNNGTFGLSNPDFEVWAKAPHAVPGMSEKNYSFAQREALIEALNGQVIWGDEMITNYRSVTPVDANPERKAYAEESIKTMDPLLARLRVATSKVASAKASDWDNAQSDARKALSEFRTTYTGMHMNAVRK